MSVVACLAGFGLAIVAEAAGIDRRDLRLGLAARVANLVVAASWAVVVVGAYMGS